MNTRRHERDRARRRLPVAERLELRVLHSADAFGPFAPLLVDDEDTVRPERDIEALLASSTSASTSVEGSPPPRPPSIPAPSPGAEADPHSPG